eukprot:9344079-Alexandrium_andersonii.AAC.1
MSASLVGSEMCIRDRLRSRAQNGSADAQGSGDRAARRALDPKAETHGGGCLLYTSPSPRD